MKNTIWVVTFEFEWASGFWWYPRREDADAAFDRECETWATETNPKVRLYEFETDLDPAADRDAITGQVETEICRGALDRCKVLRAWDAQRSGADRPLPPDSPKSLYAG